MLKKIFRQIGVFISITLFVLAMVVIYHKLRHYSFADIGMQIKKTSGLSVAMAGLLTILDYFVLTFYDTLALIYIRRPLKYPQIAMASFVGYVFGHNLTIVGGSTARYRIYSSLGVSASEVARLIIFCSTTFWVGFFTLAGLSFIFVPQNIPASLHLPFSSLLPLGIIFIAISAGYIFLSVLVRKPLKLGGWEIAAPSPAIVFGQFIVSCIDWLLACGVLYALLQNGIDLNFVHFLGIFLLAQIAGLISSVPGGLGVFETIMLLMLAPFAQSHIIFGSLLLYRLIYYFLPFGFAAGTLAINEFVISRHILKTAGVIFGKWVSAVMPHILAMTNFVAGMILLFSGSLPAEKGRMAVLRDILPLPAIEFSHFLASLSGAALILLARSIQRRINMAYYITIALLIAGIVFSMLKGGDYEEAIILSVILFAFLPCHKEFYRKSTIFARRFEPIWFVLIFLIIICSVWLGMFSYKHIEYSNQLWWSFAFHSDAPRFLRATLGAVIVVFLFAVRQLMLPSKPKKEILSSDIQQIVKQIVSDCSGTVANLALLPDKQFLFNEERTAFIMYAVAGRSCIAMSDPVGPRRQWDELLWDFREFCSEHSLWPVFYQIENTSLDLYLDMGMSFLKLGEEAKVELKNFSLDGPDNRNLRYTHNKIYKLGYTFEIIPTENLPPVLDRLKEISDSWLKHKNTREKRFSLGSFSREYISNFPTAIVRRQGEIVAFTNIWTTSQKQELSVDLMRHTADCPGGIMDYLFAQIMLWGKQQQYEWFNLGMAPLSGLADNVLAPFWHKFGTMLFRQGEHFYNFQGLRQYKQKFNPVWHSRYLACPRGLMLPRILTNLAGLISGGITGTIIK